MAKKEYSKEAQEFLKNLNRIQEDFSKEIGMTTILINSKGEPIISIGPYWEICKKIQTTKEGAEGCMNCYKGAVSAFTSGKVQDTLLINCHVNFAAMVCPVKVGVKIVGAAVGCGGAYNEEDRKKVIEVMSGIEVLSSAEFARLAEGVIPISKEDVKGKAEKLVRLIEVLAEETAFSEVFET